MGITWQPSLGDNSERGTCRLSTLLFTHMSRTFSSIHKINFSTFKEIVRKVKIDFAKLFARNLSPNFGTREKNMVQNLKGGHSKTVYHTSFLSLPMQQVNTQLFAHRRPLS